MDNRNNTIAGWVLGSCMAVLALGIASGFIVHPIKAEKPGYQIEAPTDGAEGGGAAAPAKPIAELLASANATHGADVFKKCAACHTVAQGGANGIGPNLYATVGEAIAQGKGGFAFSDALKTAGAGKKWDFEELNKWLTSPRGYASGTKMTFAGLDSATDRADVILYLNTQGSNLPLPAAPVGTPIKPAAGSGPASAPADPGGKASPTVKDIGSNTSSQVGAGTATAGPAPKNRAAGSAPPAK